MRVKPATASGLGSAFMRLWGAAMASNLADGIARLAIPLTAVTLTTDPVAIAVLTALVYVPWLLFGVPAGMIVDRVDRRYAMAAANAARLITAAGVALFIATGHVTLVVLGVAIVIFGLGETLFDNATTAITPSLVARSGLDRANGWVQAAQVGVDMFVATPISGVLYSIAVVLPLVVGGAGYLVAALLVLTLPLSAARARHEDGSQTTVPLRDALAFVWHHRYVRSLVFFTTALGTAFALAQAVTALLFLDHFAVSAGLFGVVTAGIGVGGVAGSLLTGRAVRRLGRGRTMLYASLAGGLGLVGVGFAPSAWLATVAYGLSAAGVSMWNVTWGALRQRIIPGHMLGRAIGAIRTLTWSLMPVATLAGGWIATLDLQLPYLIGGGVSVAVTIAGAGLLLRADEHVPADAVAEVDEPEVAWAQPVSPG